MPNPETIVFYYNPKKRLSTTGYFNDIIRMALKKENFNGSVPLKVIYPESKIILYFNEELFNAYIEGSISKMELVEATQCDELYRNNIKITTLKDYSIDAFSLWMRKGTNMILVDDDNYQEYSFVPHYFDVAVE